ncbi:MAG: NAD(+)/NADH kinase [Deltaproteobacteria bacterium]|nr:NAD(+)/NADH kinase [Deltaproteobacteria bacterium]
MLGWRCHQKELLAVSKTIGIVVKPDPAAVQKAAELETWLKKKGITVVRKKNRVSNSRVPCQRETLAAPADLYCAFALGGDGTFLSAVRWIGDKPIPIIGVKFGAVGFLAETVEEMLFKTASYVLSEQFKTECRMRLLVRVMRKGSQRACETVLNDLVINKGALARLATIRTSIDDNYLTTYRADGLIVSTPTGSTAYSLAAGGPIVHPQVAGILMTPICPFTLTNRPLIVPNTVSIKIELAKKSTDIMLTFDGQSGVEIDDRDTIIVQQANHPVYMIKMPDQNYFDLLKAKLRWSGSRA